MYSVVSSTMASGQRLNYNQTLNSVSDLLQFQQNQEMNLSSNANVKDWTLTGNGIPECSKLNKLILELSKKRRQARKIMYIIIIIITTDWLAHPPPGNKLTEIIRVFRFIHIHWLAHPPESGRALSNDDFIEDNERIGDDDDDEAKDYWSSLPSVLLDINIFITIFRNL